MQTSDLGTALGAGNQPPPPASPPPRRSSLLPIAILVGFVLVFVLATWERWLPATPVDVVRVEAIKRRAPDQAQATPSAGPAQVAFQAAGWIEPDPFIVRATALVSGVVASVAVVEGQQVEAGQELARLDPADFELALQAAQAREQALIADHLAAQAQLAVVHAEVQQLAARVAAQRALVDEAADRQARLAKAGRAVSQGAVEQAKLRHQAAEQQLAALRGEASVLTARQQEAEATIAQRAAALASQAVRVAQAELELERTVIRAPIAGIIQRLHAVPGRKQMLRSDAAISTTVAELFDPAQVQVRVDVALADAGGLFVGQQARISSEAWPDRHFMGEVTRLEGHADLTRNTLQAKVRIADPDPLMRPEMLCRVQFLGQRRTSTSMGVAESGGAARVQLFLPADLVPVDHQEAELWYVDADDRAQPTTVRLGARLGDRVEVLAGLAAGSWVITDATGLRPGQRVHAEEVAP